MPDKLTEILEKEVREIIVKAVVDANIFKADEKRCVDQATAKICSLVEGYHNAPAEQNEPINYMCTTAKFAEQINMPLWKVMICGKYFDQDRVRYREALQRIVDNHWKCDGEEACENHNIAKTALERKD